MAETYYIGAYWDARNDPVGTCAERLAAVLACLERCDPFFTHWLQRGPSQEAALENPVVPTAAALETVLNAGRSRTDFGNTVMEELGFHVGLWIRDTDATASLDITCGSTSTVAGGNVCLLKLPYTGTAAQRVRQPAILADLMTCLVSAWDPDWAVVNSRGLQAMSRPTADHKRRIGWMTYVPARLGTIPTLPAPAQERPIGADGTLIIATPDLFTTENPEHIDAVLRVQDTLVHVGILESEAFR